jgi:hypothetical protein
MTIQVHVPTASDQFERLYKVRPIQPSLVQRLFRLLGGR